MQIESTAGQSESIKVNEILSRANLEQVKWVMARIVSRTDREAAKAAGVHPSTVSRWPNRVDLGIAVNLLLREPIRTALRVLHDSAIVAANVLAQELTGKNKLAAANSILDRVGLRGPQQHELIAAIEHRDVTLNAAERDRALASLADAIAISIYSGSEQGDSSVGAPEPAAMDGASESSR